MRPTRSGTAGGSGCQRTEGEERVRKPSALCLIMAVGLVFVGCGTSGETHHDPPPPGVGTSAGAPGGAARVSVDTVFDVRPKFGVTLPGISQAALGEVSRETACLPTIAQFFVSVAQGFDKSLLDAVPVLPLMSLEPWDPDRGVSQSDFTLDKTIKGRWDARYRAAASVVKSYQRPVLIRFAHEMNGYWYPWASVGSNTPELFVQAWKHVVGIFRDAGATNALWVWSPNVVRGTDGTPLARYYPGDDWVDILGLTGYGVGENSASQTYDASMAQLAALSSKPILLTEVGAQRDSSKTAWIASFGSWLRNYPAVAGFIWTAMRPTDGVRADWRYDDSAANLDAFRSTLRDGKVAC